MTAKYSKLPSEDQGETDKSPVFDFSSVHNYGYPKYFSYGKNSGHGSQYKSAFTYSGGVVDEPSIIESGEVGILVKICAYLIIVLCYIGIVLTLPFSAFFSVKMVQQHERYVIFRLGKLLNAKGPGLIVILPCIDKWNKVDLRMKAFSVPPQTILTADGGGVEIGAEVYFRVKDPVQSVKSVKDLTQSCRVLAQTALLRRLIKFNMSSLETEKAKVSEVIMNEINEMTLKWGVEVSRVDLSQMKILQQPTPESERPGNPLSVLGQMLFPTGSGNIPLQLAQMAGQQPASQQRRPEQTTIPAGPEAILAALGLLVDAPNQTGSPQKPKGSSHQVTAGDSTESTFEEVSIDGPSEVRIEQKTLKTADDLIHAVTPQLSAELVHEFGCIYKFVVTGNCGGTYYLDLKNGSGDVGRGEPPAGICHVTLTLSTDILSELLSGQTSAFNAYMCGTLEVDGDISAARKLDSLIESL